MRYIIITQLPIQILFLMLFYPLPCVHETFDPWSDFVTVSSIYKMQPLEFKYPKSFTGKLSSYGLTADRKGKSGIRAAVIREKGCQCERETSYALYLAGFDVKDVHMTDLASGRETLEDVNMIVFCGGFSNSDVLGSAKGWAGGFLFNEKAKKALDNFYARPDTLDRASGV